MNHAKMEIAVRQVGLLPHFGQCDVHHSAVLPAFFLFDIAFGYQLIDGCRHGKVG